jgi:adenylate cyclase
MVIDPGGAVRRGLLFLDDGQQVYYSFALMLAISYLQTDGISPREGVPDPEHLRLGEVTIPPLESNDGAYVGIDAAGYQFLLNFRGGREPFRRISLKDLHNPDIADTVLRDSIVIVGVTADSVKDGFITPFSQLGGGDYAMPGIVLHGHIVAQLLRMARHSEQPLAVMTDSLEYLLVAVWGILGALAAFYLRELWRFILAIVVGLGAMTWMAYLALLQGWWLPLVPPVLAWILSAGVAMVFLRGRERSERKLLMDLFSRNVSADVAEEIWRQRDQFLEGGRLAASEVTATVLFSDLENFTPLSEMLGPVRLMDWLNHYMEIMAGLVMQHGGIVDDNYGDAIMADFGLPLVRATDREITQDARNAVDCALAMRTEIGHLNEECIRQGFPTVRMRVGICTGAMVAGFLGNRERMKYTTIGDTVNTAARLESYGKELPAMDAREGACRILVNANTVKRLGADYRTEPLGELALKGKARTVAVFKVIARNSHVIE